MHLGKAQEIFEQIQSKGFLTEVHQRLAEAYLALDQPEIALEFGERPLALAIERKMTVVEGGTRRIIGQAYRSLKEWAKAEEMLTQSQSILRKLGAFYELSQTLWQLVLLYQDMRGIKGSEEVEVKIRQPLEEALTLFKKLGVKFDEAKVAALH